MADEEKPPFDPTQPFEPVASEKPPFDPTQAFSPASDEDKVKLAQTALENKRQEVAAQAEGLGMQRVAAPTGVDSLAAAPVAPNLQLATGSGLLGSGQPSYRPVSLTEPGGAPASSPSDLSHDQVREVLHGLGPDVAKSYIDHQIDQHKDLPGFFSHAINKQVVGANQAAKAAVLLANNRNEPMNQTGAERVDALNQLISNAQEEARTEKPNPDSILSLASDRLPGLIAERDQILSGNHPLYSPAHDADIRIGRKKQDDLAGYFDRNVAFTRGQLGITPESEQSVGGQIGGAIGTAFDAFLGPGLIPKMMAQTYSETHDASVARQQAAGETDENKIRRTARLDSLEAVSNTAPQLAAYAATGGIANLGAKALLPAEAAGLRRALVGGATSAAANVAASAAGRVASGGSALPEDLEQPLTDILFAGPGALHAGLATHPLIAQVREAAKDHVTAGDALAGSLPPEQAADLRAKVRDDADRMVHSAIDVVKGEPEPHQSLARTVNPEIQTEAAELRGAGAPEMAKAVEETALPNASPHDFTPALRLSDGTELRGEKGKTHNDIYEANADPELGQTPLRAEDPEHGFIDQRDNKFKTRQETADALGLTDEPNIQSERIRELQDANPLSPHSFIPEAGGSLNDVLLHIIKNSKDSALGSLAKKILSLGTDTQIGIAPDIVDAAGHYRYDGIYYPKPAHPGESNVDAIVIRKGAKTTPEEYHELVMHEALHSASAWLINHPEVEGAKEFSSEIARLRSSVAAHVAGKSEGVSDLIQYALQSDHEFVAALAHPEFRDALNKIPDGKQTLLTRFLQALKKVLGIEDGSALETVFDRFMQIDPRSRNEAGKASEKSAAEKEGIGAKPKKIELTHEEQRERDQKLGDAIRAIAEDKSLNQVEKAAEYRKAHADAYPEMKASFKEVGLSTEGRTAEDKVAGDRADITKPNAAQDAIAARVATAVKENGGVTINVRGEEPSEGFAFSPDKGTETKMAVADLTPESAGAFMDRYKDALQLEGAHIGGWINPETGEVVLDISTVNSDKLAALVRAKASNQDAIYDLNTTTGLTVTDGLKEYTSEQIAAAEKAAGLGVEKAGGDVGGIQGAGLTDADGRSSEAQAADDALGAGKRPRDSVRYFEGYNPSERMLKSGHQGKPRLFDVARQLSREASRSEGGKLTERTPENKARLANSLADEAQFAVGRDNNAVGWYDRKVKATWAHLNELHPELSTDLPKRDLFTALLAVNSNGQDIWANFDRANELYEAYKKTGLIDASSEWGGKNAGAINKGLRLLQTELDANGEAGLSKFLREPMTVREMKKLGYSVPKESLDTVLNGAGVFGAKVGSFFSNLSGDFSPVTMDRWFMRTFNRLSGTLTDMNQEALPNQVSRLLNVLSDKTKVNGIAAAPVRAQLREIARSIKDGTFDQRTVQDNIDTPLHEFLDKTYRAYVNSRFADRNALNVNVKLLYENIFGVREAPMSGSERTWIREVMQATQEELGKRGIKLNNADLQAVLWYYEKELYAKLHQQPKRGAPADYEMAAKRLLDNARQSGDAGRGELGPAGARRALDEGDAGAGESPAVETPKSPSPASKLVRPRVFQETPRVSGITGKPVGGETATRILWKEPNGQWRVSLTTKEDTAAGNAPVGHRDFDSLPEAEQFARGEYAADGTVFQDFKEQGLAAGKKLKNSDFTEIPDDKVVEESLAKDKQEFVGAHRTLAKGTPVGLRIDIPAFERTGNYVVTVHEKAKSGMVGKRVGYDGIAAVNDPVFFSNEVGSEKISQGRAKFPVATVEGKFDPSRKIPADIDEWTPVGFNPKDHSYFYDKNTGEPVVSGTKAISVGNSVFVENPKYGEKSDYLYAGKKLIKRQIEETTGLRDSQDIVRDEMTKAISRAQAFGLQLKALEEGGEAGRKRATQELAQADKWMAADQEQVRQTLTQFVNKTLPPAERGRFIGAITVALKRPDLIRGDPNKLYAQAFKVMQLIETRAEEVYTKNLHTEIQGLHKTLLDSGVVSVEAKDELRKLFADVAVNKITPASAGRIRSLAANRYAEGKKVPAYLQEKLVSLTKTPLAGLSIEELEALRDEAKRIGEFGKDQWKSFKEAREKDQQLREVDLARQDTKPTEAIEKMVRDVTPTTWEKVKDKLWNTAAATGSWISVHEKARQFIPHLFDVLDGQRDGWLNRNVLKPFYTASRGYMTDINPVKNRALELSQKHNLTHDDFVNIGLHAHFMQEGTKEELMKFSNDPNLPKMIEDYQKKGLTPGQQAMYKFFRETLDANTGAMKEFFANHYNKELEFYDHYFPRSIDSRKSATWRAKRDLWVNPVTKETIDINNVADVVMHIADIQSRSRSIRKGFAEARKEGAEIPINLDSMSVFLKHMDDWSYVKNVQPHLNMVGKIANTNLFAAKYGQVGKGLVLDYIDALAKRGQYAKREFEHALDGVKNRAMVGLLGFRLSQFKHLANYPMGWREAGGPQWWARGFGAARSEEGRAFIAQHFPEILQGSGGDVTIREAAQSEGKVSKHAFVIDRILDSANRSSVALGKYFQQLDEAGHDWSSWDTIPANTDMLNNARASYVRSVGSAEVADRPLIVTKGTSVGSKTVGTALMAYQSPKMVRWGTLRGSLKDFREGRLGEGASKISVLTASSLIEAGVKWGSRAAYSAGATALLAAMGFSLTHKRKEEEDSTGAQLAREAGSDFLSSFPGGGLASKLTAGHEYPHAVRDIYGRTDIPPFDMATALKADAGDFIHDPLNAKKAITLTGDAVTLGGLPVSIPLAIGKEMMKETGFGKKKSKKKQAESYY